MTFSTYVLHQLKEMKRELLTAIEGLEGEDLTSFEPAGHWPVAWIAEHCTQVADWFLIQSVTGAMQLEYEEQVGNWTEREPREGDSYPPASEIASRWASVCDTITSYVEQATEAELQASPGREPYIQSILRIINHTNSHLRSLWCILGERRVDSKWAEQQPFLA